MISWWKRIECFFVNHTWLYFTRWDNGEISMRQGFDRHDDWRACPDCGIEQVRESKHRKWRRHHRIWNSKTWQEEVRL